MRRASILPIALMAFAIVGFLFVLSYAITKDQKWPWSVKSTTTTASTNTITNTEENVNTETNTNTTSNTNTSIDQLEMPIGPFTVGSQPILNVAYYDTGASVNTLIKLNSETGKILKQASLNLKSSTAVHATGVQLEGTATIQFGSDGDSIVFSSSNMEGIGGTSHPYSGIYRTSFSHPEIIQKIVQYDGNRLLSGQVAFIESFLYNAESGQVAYITADTTDPDRPVRSVHMVDLNGTSKIIKEYQDSLTLVGFTDHGQKLNVEVTVIPNGTNNNKGRSVMDTLTTTNGNLLKTLTVYDDTEGGADGTIDFSTNALAPNLKNYVFWDDTFGPPRLMFRNLSTKKYVGYENLDQVNNVFIPWSADSGKVFLLTKVISLTPKDGYTKIDLGGVSSRYEKYTGKIFDLAKGVIGGVDGAIYPFIWSPGPDIIFQKINQGIYSYNPQTRAEIELPLGRRHESNITGINWVNR